MKVNALIRGSIIVPLVLFLACACPLSMAQNASSSGGMVNENGSVPLSDPALADLSNPVLADLTYIWSISGIEPGQVVAALNQENETIYGQAKYEPDGAGAWNALVIGWVKGYNVELVLTYTDARGETSSRLNGTYDPVNQSIKGDLLKVSNGEEVSIRGDFEAIWINPDTTSYTPAIVAEEAAPSAASLQASSSSQELAEEAAASEDTVGFTSATEPYFHDVREDAVRILTGVGDISQIPIGMGGSGLP